MIRFAIQACDEEVEFHLADVVLQASSQLKLKFKHLGVVDWITIGTSKFLVFQSDMTQADQLLDLIFQNGRAVVRRTLTGFQVRMLNNRTGSVPTYVMQNTRKTGQFFRGTLDPHWERQFKRN